MISIGGFYYAPIKSVYGLFNGWVWVISNLNPIANLFIYSRQHKEVKIGLKAFVTCKELAPNVDLWVVKKPSKAVGKKRQIHIHVSEIHNRNDIIPYNDGQSRNRNDQIHNDNGQSHATKDQIHNGDGQSQTGNDQIHHGNGAQPHWE